MTAKLRLGAFRRLIFVPGLLAGAPPRPAQGSQREDRRDEEQDEFVPSSLVGQQPHQPAARIANPRLVSRIISPSMAYWVRTAVGAGNSARARS